MIPYNPGSLSKNFMPLIAGDDIAQSAQFVIIVGKISQYTFLACESVESYLNTDSTFSF